MALIGTSKPKPRKRQVIEDFQNHVSSGKVQFWQLFDMELVMGRRKA